MMANIKLITWPEVRTASFCRPEDTRVYNRVGAVAYASTEYCGRGLFGRKFDGQFRLLSPFRGRQTQLLIVLARYSMFWARVPGKVAHSSI
jgi:hypothetical protein